MIFRTVPGWLFSSIILTVCRRCFLNNPVCNVTKTNNLKAPENELLKYAAKIPLEPCSTWPPLAWAAGYIICIYIFKGIQPWGYTIGDIIGLFPVAYADRLKYAKIPGTSMLYTSWRNTDLVTNRQPRHCSCGIRFKTMTNFAIDQFFL